MRAIFAFVLFAATLGVASAQPALLAPRAVPSEAVKRVISVDAKTVVLRHVRVIDGTGASAVDDRAVVIEDGRIAAIGPADMAAPPGSWAIDLTGRTVLPGIVGMHDHLFYIERPNYDDAGKSDPPVLVPQMTYSAPRLYLANGVTTLRTTGSVEPYADLGIKRMIDAGALPGPRIDVTTPYIGSSPRFVQMHPLADANDARDTVTYWADRGATSVKIYTNITRAELAAAIGEAHRRGMKVTGHLCSITYPEAIALGIDNLEHGFFVNTQLDPDKQPDKCSASEGRATLDAMDPDGPVARALIDDLVRHHVALTSTLPVFEQLRSGRGALGAKAAATLSPQALRALDRIHAVRDRAGAEASAAADRRYSTDVALERRFVAAGGLLLTGPDPTGNGGVLPGFGDLRGIELLVEAGFTPEQAIRIATLNGASFLGVDRQLGSIERGKLADLVVVRGNPVRTIADIGNVEIVFKDGVGYDPAKLLASVAGHYGEY